MTSQQSKNVVIAAFEGWARGDGDFFSILADDVSWTITGSSPVAGTYTSRQDFIERAIQPIGARLSQPIRPTVERIITDGDSVVVLWNGHAVGEGRSSVRQPLLLDPARNGPDDEGSRRFLRFGDPHRPSRARQPVVNRNQ